MVSVPSATLFAAIVVANDKLSEPSKFPLTPVTSPVNVIVRAVAHFVAVPALPVVFWLPAVLTPGRSIAAEPLKDTPPIVLAVASVVAVPALPVTLPVTFPKKLPVAVTLLNDTLLVVPTACPILI